jgi:hypothetical protein
MTILSSKKILVVDDDSNFRSLLTVIPNLLSSLPLCICRCKIQRRGSSFPPPSKCPLSPLSLDSFSEISTFEWAIVHPTRPFKPID